MEFREVVRRRRMVRRFDGRPPPRQLLDAVLESALHAPSAGFAQGVDLVVLEGAEQVDWFWRVTTDPARWSEPLGGRAGAPVVVLVLSGKQAYLDRYAEPDKAGLGGWFFGVFHGEQRLFSELGVPAGHRLVGAVALGHPAPGDRPTGSSVRRRRRTFDEVVHRGRW